ncbi:hypothetical protein B0A49_04302 [Cryomyces minteri]|uniref:Reverse transcriptase domain-containing protein n=1 Tax=Cryomyces minteri TaxID=331657 RepID=A0A4U0XMX6_9PEZI|nr:hypothetical protein B0A49_04302 [Cryomyces minteri]
MPRDQVAKQHKDTMHKNTLSIVQYNVRNSREKVMAPFLLDKDIANFDVVAIQEPWAAREYAYSFIGESTPQPGISSHIADVTQVTIHNVYNPPRADPTSTFTELRARLREPGQHFVCGDFNLHHRMWAGHNPVRQSGHATQLLRLAVDCELHLLNEPGVPTHKERPGERATCNVNKRQLEHQSDHYPVVTHFQVNLPDQVTPEKYQWKRMNVELYQATLRSKIPAAQDLNTTNEIEALTDQTVTAIQESIEVSAPKARYCEWSRPGFDEECREVKRTCNRLRRRWMRTRSRKHWLEYKAARNEKGRFIKKKLRSGFRAWIEEADGNEAMLWKRARWMRNKDNPRQSFTPALEKEGGGLENAPQKKADILWKHFFPKPPEADLTDIQDFSYSPPVDVDRDFTEHEVRQALRRTALDKAPGPDKITSRPLKIAVGLLVPVIRQLANGCVRLGYWPQHFRDSFTIVLRKPKKSDYTKLKAYRPIALLNTIGKIIESMAAERISYLVERYRLLPDSHIGGRRMRSPEHALFILTERICTAWAAIHRGARPICSGLFLDISGAYDNVVHQRLTHELRRRGLPPNLVRWISSFLRDRTTRIVLPEYTSDHFSIDVGIPQGSPLSPILYLFYNANLIENCAIRSLNSSTIGYVDDTLILVVGKDPTTNCETLKRIYTEQCTPWSRKFGSVFAPDKFDLMHFVPARYRTKFNINAPLHLPGHTVTPRQGIRYLGVYLDSALTWSKHIEQVQADATRLLSGLTSLAGSTWGTRLTSLIKVYRGIVLAKALFCCSVWYIPDRGEGYAHAERAAIQKLEAIQKEAARTISGAFRRTAGSALNVELNLLAMKQELEKRIGMTLGRVVASPVYNIICEIRQEIRATSNHKLHPQLHSPLVHMERRYRAERRIQYPITELERKVPFVAEPWWVPPAIHIAPNRPQSIVEHNEIIRDLQILPVYTDGSGYKKRVGSAATIPSIPGATKKAFLGSLTDKHSVYAAELYGILMALQLLLEYLPTRKEVVIFTDNHAAIKSTHRPRYQNGQCILRQIIQTLPQVLSKGYNVQIRWISAHSGVTGNECVDAHAKEAALHGQ